MRVGKGGKGWEGILLADKRLAAIGSESERQIYHVQLVRSACRQGFPMVRVGRHRFWIRRRGGASIGKRAFPRSRVFAASRTDPHTSRSVDKVSSVSLSPRLHASHRT
jgi:hypothetical protein